MPEFCHLHLHSQYSLLDGLAPMGKLVQKAADLNMPALALTDHGGLYGAVEFYKACQGKGIKPILGCEVYVAHDHKDKSSKDEPLYHLVLLAENQQGYKNLISLITRAHIDGFFYKPRVDKGLLDRFAGGLIALSGCMAGEIPSKILKGDEKGLKDSLKDYLDIFGRNNFFLELQDHGLPEERRINKSLVDIASRENLETVATNDVHYIEKRDAYIHDVLLGVQTLSVLNNNMDVRLKTGEYYFKSQEEMKKCFGEVPDSIDNTLIIAERCRVELDFDTLHLPEIETPRGLTRDEYLEKLCFEGALRKYGSPLPARVRERLKYELKVIKEMGFVGYFLIVKDIVDYAKKHDIAVGVGRGSAPGSIVTYVLGITSVDPLKYGLIFERFLNRDRITMPDIDIPSLTVGGDF